MSHHTARGHLDPGFAISVLRREQPLFHFGRSSPAQARRPAPWEAPGIVCDARRRRVLPTDWVWRKQLCSDALLSQTDLLNKPSNNSAAAVQRPRRRSEVRRSKQRPQDSKNNSNGDVMERHLRWAYGDQLFKPGKYVAVDQLGPAIPPPRLRASASVQSLRGRIVGPLSSSVFAGNADNSEQDEEDDVRAAPAVFEWCDNAHNRNNNSGHNQAAQHRVSQRTTKRIALRRDLNNWVYLYFRARRVSWEFLVHEERTNYNLIDLYSEGVLDRWTVKLRFRMMREAPMKFPMLAFLSRLGLDSEPDIVFTTDGFYGDLLVGGLRNRSSVPHHQVSYNTTADALGLQNGDSIFVVRASPDLRTNVEAGLEATRRRSVGDTGSVFAEDDQSFEDNDGEDVEEDNDVGDATDTDVMWD